MTLTRLGDIVDLVTSGATPTVGKTELYSNEKDGIPFFRIQNIRENQILQTDLKYITREVHEKELKRSRIRPRDILITITGRLGTAAVVPEEIKEGNINQHICLLRLKKNIADPAYVAFHINSYQTHNEIVQKQHGSTRTALNHKSICSLEITLPPLKTQKQIVFILQKALSLKRKKEETTLSTKKLLQAVFLQMFGDPLDNSRWSTSKLEEVCLQVTDGTHDTPKYVSKDNGIPFLTAKNVRPYSLRLDDIKYISVEDHKKAIKRAFPQKGVILYSHIGANRGIAAEVDVDLEFSIKNVAMFRPNVSRVLSEYLVALLNNKSFREYMLRISSGGAQNFLDLDLLRSLLIPIPPLQLQSKFAAISSNIIVLRKKQAKSSHEIDSLFNSLMSKAFKGELIGMI